MLKSKLRMRYLINHKFNIDFLNKLKNRSVLNVNGLPIPRPGKLYATMTLDNGVTAEYLINFSLIGEPKLKSISEDPKDSVS